MRLGTLRSATRHRLHPPGLHATAPGATLPAGRAGPSPAPMAARGPGSSRLAKGTSASRPALRTMAARGSHATRLMGAARSPTTGMPTTGPAAAPRTAPSMASGTNGAMTRLASGEMSESRPKCSRMSGSVASWAASETPSVSRQPARGARGHQSAHGGFCRAAQGQQPGRRCQRELQADVVHHAWLRQQQTQAGDAQRCCRARWMPTLARQQHHAAHDGGSDDAGLRPGHDRVATRWRSMTRRLRARRRSPVARRRPVAMPATSAMFQPLMATTWVRPVVVKSSATARLTRSRRPMRMPDARPASGSGMARPMASSMARRSCSTAAMAPGLPRAARQCRLERAYGAPPGEEAGEARGSRLAVAPARPATTAGRLAPGRGAVAARHRRAIGRSAHPRRGAAGTAAGRRAADRRPATRRRPPGPTTGRSLSARAASGTAGAAMRPMPGAQGNGSETQQRGPRRPCDAAPVSRQRRPASPRR